MELKTRVALFFMAFFAGALWLLTWTQARNLRSAFQEMLLTQQGARVQDIASGLEEAMAVRTFALATLARDLRPELLRDRERLGRFLAAQKPLCRTFSLGFYVITPDGRGLADFPAMAGRASASYLDKDYFQAVVATGKPYIGRPVVGRFAKEPVLLMAAPVVDRQGRVAAVLVGANQIHGTDLFSDLQVTGDATINIISPRDRIFIASTDRPRILAPIAPRGVNRMLDRYLDGFQGSGIMVTSHGTEALASGCRIPSTGWVVDSFLPTAMAFAPFRAQVAVLYRNAWAASLAIAVAGWVFLLWQLSPLDACARMIHSMATGRTTPHEVPLEGAPEIRRLQESFNVLHGRIAEKEAGQAQAEQTLRERNLELEHQIGERQRAFEQQRALEVRLRQSEKLEAIGQLAGGIAHDFNNMLTAIQGSAEVLDRLVMNDPAARAMVSVISQAAQRSAGLTGQLLAFSRKGQQHSEVMVARDLVQEVLSLLERTVDKGITLATRFEAADDTIQGDPALLQSALLNLGINARDAMPGGGTLTFRTADALLDAQACEASSTPIRPGRYLELSVIDTGHGMAPEVLQRVFEPFFTTKEPGKGTGLGLAAVYGTLIGQRGGIRITSAPGRGTSVRLFLPLADPRPRSQALDPERCTGTGGVLLVDDEELLRQVGKAVLADAGYQVFLAADGLEALEVLAWHGDEIALVVLDMQMPRMGGKETLLRIMDAHPGARVLIASGFHQEGTVEDLMRIGAVGFLKKPCMGADLCRAVAQGIQGAGKIG